VQSFSCSPQARLFGMQFIWMSDTWQLAASQPMWTVSCILGTLTLQYLWYLMMLNPSLQTPSTFSVAGDIDGQHPETNRHTVCIANHTSAVDAHLSTQRVLGVVRAWQACILSGEKAHAHLACTRLQEIPSPSQIASWENSVFFAYHCSQLHQIRLYIDLRFVGAECLLAIAAASGSNRLLRRRQNTQDNALVRLCDALARHVLAFCAKQPQLHWLEDFIESTRSCRTSAETKTAGPPPARYFESADIDDFIRAGDESVQTHRCDTRWPVLFAILNRVRTIFLAHSKRDRLRFYTTVHLPTHTSLRHAIGLLAFDVQRNIGVHDFTAAAERQYDLACASNSKGLHDLHAVIGVHDRVDFVVNMASSSGPSDDAAADDDMYTSKCWSDMATTQFPLFVGVLTSIDKVRVSYDTMDNVHVVEQAAAQAGLLLHDRMTLIKQDVQSHHAQSAPEAQIAKNHDREDELGAPVPADDLVATTTMDGKAAMQDASNSTPTESLHDSLSIDSVVANVMKNIYARVLEEMSARVPDDVSSETTGVDNVSDVHVKMIPACVVMRQDEVSTDSLAEKQNLSEFITPATIASDSDTTPDTGTHDCCETRVSEKGRNQLHI
jgi:hypothetical protein